MGRKKRSPAPAPADRPVSIDWDRQSEMGSLLAVAVELHGLVGDSADLGYAGFMVLARAYVDAGLEIERRGFEREFRAVCQAHRPIPRHHALAAYTGGPKQ